MWTWFKVSNTMRLPSSLLTCLLLFLVSRSSSQTDPKSREVVLNACKAVGSISNTSFDIRFNPDIFSPGKHDEDDSSYVEWEEAWQSLYSVWSVKAIYNELFYWYWNELRSQKRGSHQEPSYVQDSFSSQAWSPKTKRKNTAILGHYFHSLVSVDYSVW